MPLVRLHRLLQYCLLLLTVVLVRQLALELLVTWGPLSRVSRSRFPAGLLRLLLFQNPEVFASSCNMLFLRNYQTFLNPLSRFLSHSDMIQLLCLFCLRRVLAQIHERLTERQRRGSREQCVLRALNEDVCGETFFVFGADWGSLHGAAVYCSAEHKTRSP